MSGSRTISLTRIRCVVAIAGLAALAGCHDDMWIQPKAKPLQQSDFFADGHSSRPQVPHSIPRGDLRIDDALYAGRVDGKLVKELPIAIGELDLKIGQERFNIYCSPCHGKLGDGHGMIAERGFNLRRKPASYHTDRLREMPIGHFFEVITEGHGVMYPYASRVKVDDRWRIAAYIRVLQKSQNVNASQLDPAEQQKIDAPPTAGEGHGAGAVEAHPVEGHDATTPPAPVHE
jgi:mono/diheme cytochrome c family protein